MKRKAQQFMPYDHHAPYPNNNLGTPTVVTVAPAYTEYRFAPTMVPANVNHSPQFAYTIQNAYPPPPQPQLVGTLPPVGKQISLEKTHCDRVGCKSFVEYDILKKVTKLIVATTKKETGAGWFSSFVLNTTAPERLFVILRRMQVETPQIFKFIGEELFASLNLNNARTDIRLQKSFLFPKVDQLDVNAPVGTLVFDVARERKVCHSHLDDLILGENVRGRSWTSLMAFKVQAAAQGLLGSQVIQDGEPLWTQWIFRASNGSYKVILSFLTCVKHTSYIEMKFQDVSEKQKYILLLPPLQ